MTSRRRWWLTYTAVLALAAAGLAVALAVAEAPTWVRVPAGVAGAIGALLAASWQHEHPARRERDEAHTRFLAAAAAAEAEEREEARGMREVARSNGHPHHA